LDYHYNHHIKAISFTSISTGKLVPRGCDPRPTQTTWCMYLVHL